MKNTIKMNLELLESARTIYAKLKKPSWWYREKGIDYEEGISTIYVELADDRVIRCTKRSKSWTTTHENPPLHYMEESEMMMTMFAILSAKKTLLLSQKWGVTDKITDSAHLFR